MNRSCKNCDRAFKFVFEVRVYFSGFWRNNSHSLMRPNTIICLLLSRSVIISCILGDFNTYMYRRIGRVLHFINVRLFLFNASVKQTYLTSNILVNLFLLNKF